MKKIFPPRPGFLIIILILTIVSCYQQPEALFTSDAVIITAGESVQYTDQSLNEPITWDWTFEGGTPSYSTEQDPLITYYDVGTYSVTLEATNRGGTGMITRDAYVTVVEPTTDVTFYNNTFKDIRITVDYTEKIIESSGSVTFYGLEGNSVAYYAETSGQTTSGTQVGLLLYWDNSIDLEGGTLDWDLNIGSDFYFMRITNNGTHVLTPLEVTQGLGDVMTENIVIPNDGVKYDIGYYEAYSETLVKGYFEDDPDSWVYWENFTFPGTVNQVKELTSSIKKGTGKGAGFLPEGLLIYELEPASGYEPVTTIEKGANVHFPRVLLKK